MSKDTQIDITTISLDELRRLADAEAAKDPDALAQADLDAQLDADEPDGDNKSQVLDAILDEDQQDAQADEKDEDVPETVYRRVIDLGDGSGVQVFEASSLEELVDKLAEAQKNATKKIRDLSYQKKQDEQETADKDFVASQELMQHPTSAFKKLFESTVGMPIETFKTKVARIEAWEKAESDNTASTGFVKANPEYVANEANGKKLVKYLEAHNLPVTEDNLNKAFKDLKEIGLIELKSKDVTAEPSEEELRTMPLDKLRDLASRSK